MNKKVIILLFIVLCAVPGGLVWRALSQRDPEYRGKPLGFWIEGYDEGTYKEAHPDGPPGPTAAQADEAIRHLGTNTIPALLRMLQTHESRPKAALIRFLQRHNINRFHFAPANLSFKAFRGFKALGVPATNAMPQLIAIFERDSSALPEQGIPVIWADIGAPASGAVDVLLRHGLTHTNEIVRNNSIVALRQIHPDAKLVVPAMIRSLKDPDAMVEAQAIRTLAAYGKDAAAAAPLLVQMSRNEPPPPKYKFGQMDGTSVSISWDPFAFAWGPSPTPLAKLAKDTLQSIDPDAAAKAGVK